MADEKISELTEKTIPVADDLLAIVDSGVSPNVTKKIKYSNLRLTNCRAYLATGVQSIEATTFTKILLNAEDYDAQNEFVPYTDNPTTQARFTAGKAGLYLIIGTIYYNTGQLTKRWDVIIRKNGTAIQSLEYYFSSATAMVGQAVTIASLDASGYIELWTYHNCDVAKDVYYGTAQTNLIIQRIA